jgi:hypothetical protein
MLRFFAILFLSIYGQIVFAQAGYFNDGAPFQNHYVTDNSCAAAMKNSLLNTNGFQIIACSSDPIGVGTTLVWYSPSTNQFQTPKVVEITATSASTSTCTAPPIDYVYAGKVWALAFSTVLFLWFSSTGIGVVLSLIKGRR